MSDDRRFEREARAWLELGPTDAPDRVIEAALLDIDQTSQDRDFRVPWRLPIMSSSSRIAAVVLIAVVATGAAFVFLRPSPGNVGAATPSPSNANIQAPSPSALTVASFKFARDAICSQAVADRAPLETRYRKIFDGTATAAEQADGVNALREFVSFEAGILGNLAALEVPSDLRDGHLTYITQTRDILTLITYELKLLDAGDRASALAVDLSTDAIGSQAGAWEKSYNFLNCP